MASENLNELIESALVVDDSALQRQHTVSLLHELGVDMIYEAGNGNEALDLLALLKLPPGLAVIDLEMPGMDGIELIQHLQQKGVNMPLIVASSREASLLLSVETMIQALGMRVLGALQKPLSQEKLKSALRSFTPTRNDARQNFDPQPSMCESDLAAAIAGGQVVPYYQPKVDVQTGILKGVEALARWLHPERGMIPPDRFIPMAEQCGLIHDLTISMMDQAMAQAAVWHSRGLAIKVAVNLSPLSLEQSDFMHRIMALVDRHALPADRVVLEITESSVVANKGNSLGTLARLRLKGFGLSIDDYGTGFSSMQQLARIPFTELKIDRSFVHGAHERKNLRVILQSALDMAQRLELVTVAEGIETMEDWRLLQDFGCNIGQGYLIAKPMPANELPLWLKGHHRRLAELRPLPREGEPSDSAQNGAL
ncbi:EAL domain-containing response regulator [Herbaspirillum robiniae]|uniref:EAL domain-containing response regulator n=1 Tax=Herbaspirillum robiniae TaxID=2014887 RepID=A0ABX2LPB4_9BURK|nr:EAL domain-containing response regulator [Herbaspirillum robiniae]NUU00407.1 EAL domain-containing response regulator [Herbaspirillum robiniae]